MEVNSTGTAFTPENEEVRYIADPGLATIDQVYFPAQNTEGTIDQGNNLHAIVSERTLSPTGQIAGDVRFFLTIDKQDDFLVFLDREATAGSGRDFIGDNESDKYNDNFSQYFDSNGNLHRGIVSRGGEDLLAGQLNLTITHTDSTAASSFYADASDSGSQVYVRLIKMYAGLYSLGFIDGQSSNDSGVLVSGPGSVSFPTGAEMSFDVQFTGEGVDDSVISSIDIPANLTSSQLESEIQTQIFRFRRSHLVLAA